MVAMALEDGGGSGLAMALSVVRASAAPMLLVTPRGQIIGASDSFHEIFGIPMEGTVGQLVIDLDHHRWNVPRLRSLMTSSASGIQLLGTYECAVDTTAHGLLTVAMGTSMLDGANPDELLLISVEDRTAKIAAECERLRLVSDNAMLMREVQHRIANSLQIIASILLQSARRVRSAEARGKIQDAHQRIVSIAKLQRQLSETADAEVDLHDYLARLCESIAASMIGDPQHIRLLVTADHAIVAPARSVTTGLVVTELVINALKHGFTAACGGNIRIGYDAGAGRWVLTVEDDGVGRPVTAERTVGLGTHIVDALARQLGAVVEVVALHPGTRVNLREEVAARSDVVAGDAANRRIGAWMRRVELVTGQAPVAPSSGSSKTAVVLDDPPGGEQERTRRWWRRPVAHDGGSQEAQHSLHLVGGIGLLDKADGASKVCRKRAAT